VILPVNDRRSGYYSGHHIGSLVAILRPAPCSHISFYYPQKYVLLIIVILGKFLMGKIVGKSPIL